MKRARASGGLPRIILLISLGLALNWCVCPQLRAAPVINIVVSKPSDIYQEAASGLIQALGRDDWRVTITSADYWSGARDSELTVAVGTLALEKALARPGRPVLALLVPRLAYERMAAGQRLVAALYLDQPLPRQLQLLGLVLPGLKRAAAPLGPSSAGLQTALQHAANETGIQVRVAQVREASDLYGALSELATDSEAFVLLPDSVVAERNMLQNFLLHTYRLRKPVLAYSAPLSRSGALLALYATPAQIGEEAASWIRQSWRNGEFHLGVSRYPQSFTIGINRTVARSLDIAMPGEDVLASRLRAMQ